MHRTRVYVDTSVFGGVGDEELAEWSVRFFDQVQAGRYVVLISRITLDELSEAPTKVQTCLEALPEGLVQRVPVGGEARELAGAYLEAGILGAASVDDAAHVAAATVAGADLVLNWNFRHIVNYERIRKLNAVNLLKGYKPLDIRSPREMDHGDEGQDI